MSVPSYYIDGIQDYLEDLCTKNKIVQHMVPVDGAPDGRRSFARFESDEQMTAIRNNGSRNIVVVADYYGQRIGDVDDQKLRITLSVIYAVKKKPNTGNETEAINEAITTAETIMFQFWNKMEKDFQEGCNALENLEPDKVTWTKIDQPWLDDYYGWEMHIPFGSYMPSYDAEDWEEDQ